MSATFRQKLVSQLCFVIIETEQPQANELTDPVSANAELVPTFPLQTSCVFELDNTHMNTQRLS